MTKCRPTQTDAFLHFGKMLHWKKVLRVVHNGALPHPVYACVFRIALHFPSNNVGLFMSMLSLVHTNDLTAWDDFDTIFMKYLVEIWTHNPSDCELSLLTTTPICYELHAVCILYFLNHFRLVEVKKRCSNQMLIFFFLFLFSVLTMLKIVFFFG